MVDARRAAQFPRRLSRVASVIVAMMLALGLSACGIPQFQQNLTEVLPQIATGLAPPVATQSARPVSTPLPAPLPALLPASIDGLPVVTRDQLPPQARETLALIEQGGPFPYRQDGSVFQNRERLLPRKPAGYYREYTVRTPGSPDRGARRIVMGDAGEIYYTADHYRSFARVLP